MLRGLFSVPLKKSKEHKNMEFLTGAVQKEDLGIAEILAGDYEGKNIKVKGAIHTIRDMGEVAFIVLRRRDGLIQCVYEPGKSQFSVDDLKEADTVEVCGTYKSDDRSPNGFELRLDTITLLSEPAEPMPLQINKWELNTSLEAQSSITGQWHSEIQESVLRSVYRRASQGALGISFIIMDLQKFIRQSLVQSQPREEPTSSSLNISTDRLYYSRARSFTSR